jgi:hypothetical protein
MQSDPFRRAAAYWSRKRAGRRFPPKDEIDPAQLGAAALHVAIVDMVDGDYLHRYAGAAVERALAIGMQDLSASALEAQRPAFKAWRNGLESARALGAPHMANLDIDGRRARVAFLPVAASAADDRVDQVFAVVEGLPPG